MIVDTSSVIAVLRDEADAPLFAHAIANATERRMSAVNFVEAAIVIDAGRDPIAMRRFDDFISEADISVEPVTPKQAQIAREAYRDFGKGSGHKAQLNFGDCFAYALAKEVRQPLLFKGDDFKNTDLVSAI
jgi:ribonuclease VapC